MMQGKIVKSGGPELAQRLEAEGYDWIKQELGIEDETVGKKLKQVRRIIMTTETNYHLKKMYLFFFKRNSEPAWLKNFVLKHWSRVKLPMPKPDKTKIDKWNFNDLKVHT